MVRDGRARRTTLARAGRLEGARQMVGIMGLYAVGAQGGKHYCGAGRGMGARHGLQRMARAKKATAKVEEVRPYVEGVAKNLVERASTAAPDCRGASP
jgi:hypothetical protein